MTFNNAKIFLGLPTCLLKYCGLWIVSEKYESLNNIYRFFGFLLHYSVLLSILIYLGVVWGNIEAMSNALYVLFTETSTCFKITVFVVNKKFILNLLEFMNSDIFLPMTRRQEDILMEQARKARYLTIFLVATANINVVEWCIIPLLNQGDVKTFPYTMWMPADTQKSPGYQLGYIYQSLFGIMCANMFMGIDGFIISAITFACAQLDIIKDKVQKIRSVPSGQRINIREEERCSINNNLFDECISQHQSIIQYVKLVEGLFHLSIFLQLSGSVIIVCMLGFRLSVEPPNTFEFYSSLNYMLNMLAQLFFYCWSGNELTKRSEDVRNELYLCQWHEQDMKLKKKLCFAMECLKKPILFQAGHYITLSRPTFVRILRCSYSYFAVLNQVNKK
ncbi:odorant receptor Or1-like [Achroia grisella]|uniref:odorant receptor Or1-like n=1 Tax=Achroia grisella TaxID=688607 RepID=UPI0027D31391|nr:odorant receptor Or1-like [Achroia grisella]